MESLEEQWTSTAGSTPHSQCQGEIRSDGLRWIAISVVILHIIYNSSFCTGLGGRLERNTGLGLQKRSVKTNHILGWHHQMMRLSDVDLDDDDEDDDDDDNDDDDDENDPATPWGGTAR